jgi:repressor LexA
MHPTQQKILNLAASIKINKKNPRIIARLIEVQNPQNIVHHIKQLEDKGFISINKDGAIKVEKNDNFIGENLFQLPIYGSASCGPATMFAEENLQSYLAVPSGKIGKSSKSGLFVVMAEGDSLNDAKGIKGGAIETGDYVVIDGNNKSPKDGQYVLSIIDGMANLKRFYKDDKNKQIRLESESKMETKPIYIQQDHFEDYMINGVILGVIKK